ncbi:MAG: tetratricopeptide repeat protein [Desulfobacter sp.]
MKKVVVPVFAALLTASLVLVQFTPAAGGSEKVLFDKGVSLMKQEKFQDAVGVFSELIGMKTVNPDIYKNRGVAYMRLNQYDLAIEDFEKTRELKPDLKGLYSNLGVAWYYKGDYTRAIKNYNMEIALAPENHYAYFNRAICNAELGEFDLSLADVEKSLALSPDFYLAQCLKGDLLAKTGKPAQAREAYEKAIAIDSDNPYARDQLAGLKLPEKTAGADQPVVLTVPERRPKQPETRSKSPAPVKTAPAVAKEPNGEISPIKAKSGPSHGRYELQAGAFRKKQNADVLYQQLETKGYQVRILELTRPSGIHWFLVRTGVFDTKSAATAGRSKIKTEAGMDFIVRPFDRF